MTAKGRPLLKDLYFPHLTLKGQVNQSNKLKERFLRKLELIKLIAANEKTENNKRNKASRRKWTGTGTAKETRNQDALTSMLSHI